MRDERKLHVYGKIVDVKREYIRGSDNEGTETD